MEHIAKGRLIEKGETEAVNDNLNKRLFVIETTDTKYPEFLQFELYNTYTDKIDPFEIGHDINVSFNVRGRKWDDPNGGTRYFTSLNAWKILAVNV